MISPRQPLAPRRPSNLPPLCNHAIWENTPPGAAKNTIFAVAFMIHPIAGGQKILCKEHLDSEKQRVASACVKAAEALPGKLQPFTRLSQHTLRAQLKQLLARPGEVGLLHWDALFQFMGSGAALKEKRIVHKLWSAAEGYAVEHRDLQRAVRIDGPCRCHFGTRRIDRAGQPLKHPGIR